MRNSGLLLLSISLLTAAAGAQTPDHFYWVDQQQDPAFTKKVDAALVSARQKFTAIRRIGVLRDSALVFTVSRNPDEPTPDYDRWQVNNLDLRSLRVTSILSGYQLKTNTWVRFTRSSAPDLILTYKDCWGCNPGTLLTAVHWDSEDGWEARWTNEGSPANPGAVLAETDIGSPYTDDVDIAQIYALEARRERPASLLTLLHTRNAQTGKVTTTVTRYFVDPKSGDDKVEILKPRESRQAVAEVCHPREPVLAGGQDSAFCSAQNPSTAKTPPPSPPAPH